MSFQLFPYFSIRDVSIPTESISDSSRASPTFVSQKYSFFQHLVNEGKSAGWICHNDFAWTYCALFLSSDPKHPASKRTTPRELEFLQKPHISIVLDSAPAANGIFHCSQTAWIQKHTHWNTRGTDWDLQGKRLKLQSYAQFAIHQMFGNT